MSTTLTDDNRYQRDQLEAMGGEPVVLNLGCGTDTHGIGIDINYNPDIQADLNDGIPAAADSVDEILASHVLEHLENPSQFLRECRRVLRPSGQLRLEVPNGGWLPVRVWLFQDLQRFWAHKDPDRRGHWLARRLGNTDEERTAHLTLWTLTLLKQHLDRAGFDYSIQGWHGSRNFTVTAQPPSGDSGQTLHELERAADGDLASQDYWAQTRSRIITQWVNDHQPSNVLDVGCGSGYLTAAIASQTTTETVIGIDADPDSIDVASQRDSPAQFRVDDAFDLDYPEGAFDCLILGDVLEHFEEPTRLLRELRPLLGADGALIVSVPALRMLYGPHDEHNGHHDRYTRGRLAAVARDADLQVERARYTNALPLVPYWFYQRVLGRQIPAAARGGHSSLVERLKEWAIGVESRLAPPVGVTLLAELSADPE